MKIRLIKKNEIKKAVRIVVRNYGYKYESNATREIKEMFGAGVSRPVYYVAEEKSQILGFAGYTQSWMDYHIYEIFWVNVMPERQGQGIGRSLITKIIKEIKNKKNAHLILLTANGNKKLPNYYKKYFGFKTVQLFDKHSYHLMRLSLEK